MNDEEGLIGKKVRLKRSGLLARVYCTERVDGAYTKVGVVLLEHQFVDIEDIDVEPEEKP